jgi:hypothetical protein
MTAIIVPFPNRGPFGIRRAREGRRRLDGRNPGRFYGQLHGDFCSDADARENRQRLWSRCRIERLEGVAMNFANDHFNF